MTADLSDRPTTGPSPIDFEAEGATLRGLHVPASDDALAGPGGRPAVVLAHGLGGTVDSGLVPFAERLAAAGLEALAFDYRGFGASGGSPRQTVSVAGQVADYRAALRAAAALPGVDPTRLVLWGVSLSGGHVLEVAAGRDDIAAVVSLTPLVNGAAAGRLALAHHSTASILRSTVAGVASRAGRRRTMPIVGRPGETAALSLEGHYDDYTALAGPTWLNEVDAAVGLELGSVRVGRAAGRVRRARARADRRLRPQRAAVRRGQGRVQGAGRGAPLPLRPLRRVAGQAVVRVPPPTTRSPSCGGTWNLF